MECFILIKRHVDLDVIVNVGSLYVQSNAMNFAHNMNLGKM